MTLDGTELALVRKTFESALVEAGGDAVPWLVELGWAELHDTEPAVATGELFEAQGRLGRATGALDVVATLAMGERLEPGTAVLHPGLGAWDRAPGIADGDTLRFDGLVVAGIERAHRLLVPFEDNGSLGVAGVALDAGPLALTIRPVAGLDPGLALVAVSGAVPHSEVSGDPGMAGPAVPAMAAGSAGLTGPGRSLTETGRSWERSASLARRALAHELCGLAQAMLDQAAAHVTDRHQFGRPIAAFQTVRHRLTEVVVALASARSALDAAWAAGEPLLADAAKVLAGRAGLLAARHCLQVTGAIGFTEEYELAAQIRRVHALDALYGGADALQARIGEALLAGRSVPRLHPLP